MLAHSEAFLTNFKSFFMYVSNCVHCNMPKSYAITDVSSHLLIVLSREENVESSKTDEEIRANISGNEEQIAFSRVSSVHRALCLVPRNYQLEFELFTSLLTSHTLPDR